MLRTQHNAWIHAAATAAVAVTGAALRLSAPEWCWIVLAVIAVWTAEALNTAFEFLTDVASPSSIRSPVTRRMSPRGRF